MLLFFFLRAELKTIFLSSFSPHLEQSVNPYIVKLSIVDDEATLNVSTWFDSPVLLETLFDMKCRVMDASMVCGSSQVSEQCCSKEHQCSGCSALAVLLQ